MNLSSANAVDYLRSRGFLAPDEPAKAADLSGGVSNAVIHITRSGGDDLVVKQVREKLNVVEPWYCGVERIWREVEVLRHCERLLGHCRPGVPFTMQVPRLLFEDRENYVFAMTAAPADHIVWKQELMSGVARQDVAVSCGRLLGTLHRNSWHDTSLAGQLDDRQFFGDLRLDPYYRQIARVHEDLASHVERLIHAVWTERHCLVHGDFSPKNLLIHGNHLTLIDFEVGHFGDPAFDVGFILSHLALKAMHHAPLDPPIWDLTDSFWNGYRTEMLSVVSSQDFDALMQRGILNFAACALARLDGKSRIDYLDDGDRRDAVRELCRTLFARQPRQWADVRQLARRPVSDITASNED